ncbi:MAG: hypothetical protein SPI30_04650 [Prevotella sp.]|nr:hypothetical protein [Prevotella sp.]
MSNRLVVGLELTQHNALCLQVPKFRDSGEEPFSWRTDTEVCLYTFRLILQNMVVRHHCRDSPHVCPKYPVSIGFVEGVACYTEEKRRRNCRQTNENRRKTTLLPGNEALAA